jgi:hypothetical protein
MKDLIKFHFIAVGLFVTTAVGMIYAMGIDIYPSDLPYIILAVIIITFISVIANIVILIIQILKEENEKTLSRNKNK